MAWPFLTAAPQLAGARVTVLGLGLFGGGVGVTRFLAASGARVTVTDMKPAAELRESVDQLKGLPVELHLGGHRDGDFRETDLVVVSPAVPAASPQVAIALERGIPLETEMNLFFKLCRARRVVGVTGSNGKTTTTALIGVLLQRGPSKVWVGGNIGGSLLEHLDEVGIDDIVVLELSSFQLENLGAIGRSPGVAVVMNLTPNHLDRHVTMEAYADAKRQIVAHQKTDDVKILNADDPMVAAFASPSRTLRFSLKGPADAWAHDERIETPQGSIDLSGRKLPGWFNLQNMAAATLAASAVWPDVRGVARDVLTSFPGVEHRLEAVGEFGGVTYYNDSIATNPESTLAALDTLKGPIVLLLGGRDKNLDFRALGRRVAERVRVAVLVGETAEKIAAVIPAGPEVRRAATFDEAVAMAREAARPGDTVLLSPACASFDMFRNFAERGRRFKELVSR
jgi:UDP-N-acetylmuramoylalanine--D-glutamate ligase